MLGATVAGLAASSGCSLRRGGGSDPGSGSTTAYDVANRDASEHRVLFGAAPNGVTGFRVTRTDGTTTTVEATTVGEIPASVYDGAVRIRPRGEGVRIRDFRVPTSSRVTGEFEDLPSGTSVFYAIGPTDELVRSTGFAICDGAVPSAIEVELLRDTAYVQTTTCGDPPARLSE